MVIQKQCDSLSVLWNIQGFKIQYVEIREAPTDKDKHRRIKVIGLTDIRNSHICGDCGKHHKEGCFQETEPRIWRDCSIGDFETYVEIIPWRVACCDGTRIEMFPWESKGHRMTRRFFERVAALCTKLQILQVSSMVDLSWDTVSRVDKEAIQKALGGNSPILEGMRFIGVDEVSRTGGQEFFTMVTNLENGAVVWIAEGKRKIALEEFFKKLGKRGCKKIQIVTSDLGAGYVEVIGRYTPHACHILDRFHIVKWLNESLKEIRRRVFGGSPKDQTGRVLKVKQWMLLRAREKLDQREKRLLAQLVHSNWPLYRAYLLKEQLRSILHHPWRYLGSLIKNIEDWCSAAVRSRIPELKAVGWRLRPHIEKVVAGFDGRIKQGLVEANNGKVDLLRREAHGYRDTEYFKLKIFQKCSLPSNPWADIIL